MSVRRTLRGLVARKQGLVVPGAFDGVSVRLVERAGFPAVYMTGYGTSASRLGLPDLGYAGLAEMADHARNLAAAVSIPLIADADTGYGNALGVRRTVQAYEAAGVAGLHIEDQVAPKRCGHLSGHQIVPLGEFAGKIRAAVEARRDPDLLIIARTDAISAVGFDEALRRGEAAAKAGADVLFIEAPRDEAQVERVARAFDTPLLYNYAAGGRSPLLPFPRLRALGYAIIILPVDTLLVATKAMASFLTELRARRRRAGARRPPPAVRGVQCTDRRHGSDGDGRPLPGIVTTLSRRGAGRRPPTRIVSSWSRRPDRPRRDRRRLSTVGVAKEEGPLRSVGRIRPAGDVNTGRERMANPRGGPIDEVRETLVPAGQFTTSAYCTQTVADAGSR